MGKEFINYILYILFKISFIVLYLIVNIKINDYKLILVFGQGNFGLQLYVIGGNKQEKRSLCYRKKLVYFNVKLIWLNENKRVKLYRKNSKVVF